MMLKLASFVALAVVPLASAHSRMSCAQVRMVNGKPAGCDAHNPTVYSRAIGSAANKQPSAASTGPTYRWETLLAGKRGYCPLQTNGNKAPTDRMIAKVKAGEDLYIGWPSNNHEHNGGDNIHLYWEGGAPITKNAGDTFNLNLIKKENEIGTIDYFDFRAGSGVQCGSAKPGQGPIGSLVTGGFNPTSDRICWGKFKIPTNMAPGLHRIIWYWTLGFGKSWDDGRYFDCLWVQVTGSDKPVDPPSGAPKPEQCTVEDNFDYNGNDIANLPTPDVCQCSDACKADPACAHFTYSKGTSTCYKKSSKAGRLARTGFSSGTPSAKVAAGDQCWNFEQTKACTDCCETGFECLRKDFDNSDIGCEGRHCCTKTSFAPTVNACPCLNSKGWMASFCGYHWDMDYPWCYVDAASANCQFEETAPQKDWGSGKFVKCLKPAATVNLPVVDSRNIEVVWDVADSFAGPKAFPAVVLPKDGGNVKFRLDSACWDVGHDGSDCDEYAAGNLLQVDKAAYDACTDTTGKILSPTEGMVSVEIKPGAATYFISSVPANCMAGQKVMASLDTNDSPTIDPPAGSDSSSGGGPNSMSGASTTGFSLATLLACVLFHGARH